MTQINGHLLSRTITKYIKRIKIRYINYISRLPVFDSITNMCRRCIIATFLSIDFTLFSEKI